MPSADREREFVQGSAEPFQEQRPSLRRAEATARSPHHRPGAAPGTATISDPDPARQHLYGASDHAAERDVNHGPGSH